MRSSITEEYFPERRLHIDKRADQLVEQASGEGDDDMLNTTAVAEWLGVSTQFLEIGRHRGYGPRFIRLTSRIVRYQRGDVLDWLRERRHRRTLEYTKAPAKTAGSRERAAGTSASS
jgi:predicted DNA-binding transcriptional regulator AlpA